VLPAAPAAPPLELTAAPALEPVQLAILTPTAGQSLAVDDASSTVVDVHSARPDWVVELSLDGRRARPLATLPPKPTLGDLNEGAPLAPGAHHVVAALRAGEQAPARFALARFFVGGDAPPSAPLVHCARPSGTFYGPAGTPQLLDFAVDGVELGAAGSLLVRATPLAPAGPAREARLKDASARLVHGLGAGDWLFELELFGAGAEPLGKHRCELTVNEVKAP
jgi:hypothetical protein